MKYCREYNSYRILKMRIISIINQKGGVGKTTTTVNLAYALAMDDYKVTIIDLDPQAHLTTSMGLGMQQQASDEQAQNNIDTTQGIDSVLLGTKPIETVTHEIRQGLQIIPAGLHLNDVEHMSEGGASRGLILKKALAGKLQDQDFILIDCPPSSGLLAINALFAASEVLVPVVGDYLALCGVSRLMQTLKSFEAMAKTEITTWFALTRYYPRGRLAREVMNKLVQCFPGRVLGTSVRETIAIAESPGHGKSIFEYSPRSHGAEDYRGLAQDLVQGRAM